MVISFKHSLLSTAKKELISHSQIFFDGKEDLIIIHTPEEAIRKKILKGVVGLYQEAVDMDPSQKKPFIEQLGLIFWWLCQAKPYDRGDPSIAEMLIRALANLKGITLPPWKDDLIPWEEVMLTFDPEEFKKKFHTLFATDPLLS